MKQGNKETREKEEGNQEKGNKETRKKEQKGKRNNERGKGREKERERKNKGSKQRATSCNMILMFTHKDIWNNVSPLDKKLLKMHAAEVHVFSDSVLCVGSQAMGETSGHVAKQRLDEHLECDTEVARGIDGKRVHF